jgi:hypothetical protein
MEAKKARRPKKIQPTSFAVKKTAKTQRLYSVYKKYDAEKFSTGCYSH